MRKLLVLLFVFLPVTAAASPIYEAADGISGEGISHIEEILADFDFREAVDAYTKGEDTSLWQRLWDGLCRFATGAVRSSLPVPLSAAAIAIFASLLGRVGEGQSAGEVGFFLAYAAAIGLSASAFGDVAALSEGAAQDMGTFTAAALPALSALSASSGGAGALMHPALLAASAAGSLLVTRVGIPAVSVSLALSAIGRLSPHSPLPALSSLLRRTALWVVCGSLTLFSAILSVTGYAAGTLSTAATRGLRYAAGSLVPVLGSFLADSAEAVSFSALLLKGAAGAAGTVLLFLLMLYPVIRAAAGALLFRLSSALAKGAADPRIAAALSDIADALSTLSGMTAAAGVFAILSLGMLTRTGSMGVILR